MALPSASFAHDGIAMRRRRQLLNAGHPRIV
jgi:hypothetical protein